MVCQHNRHRRCCVSRRRRGWGNSVVKRRQHKFRERLAGALALGCDLIDYASMRAVVTFCQYVVGAFVGLGFAFLLSTAGEADWAYTHWGMSPEQVVAASGGTVRLLPPDQRSRDDADHWELSVDGTFIDEAMRLPVGFAFDLQTHGLRCVMINAFGSDVAKLRKTIDRRYGMPSRESMFDHSTTATWTTPDRIELVTGERPLAAIVNHCMP
jgi:hypothetical protein